MRQNAARTIFDQALAATHDRDQIARLELLREYITNTTFRHTLAGALFEAQEAPGSLEQEE